MKKITRRDLTQHVGKFQRILRHFESQRKRFAKFVHQQMIRQAEDPKLKDSQRNFFVPKRNILSILLYWLILYPAIIFYVLNMIYSPMNTASQAAKSFEGAV